MGRARLIGGQFSSRWIVHGLTRGLEFVVGILKMICFVMIEWSVYIE